MTLETIPAGRGETILVVDDESVTRMMVRKVLEESHYHVMEAEDGVQALQLAQQAMPDLILLDVRMPRMNGFETCHALRELEPGRHLPILMLTGLDDVVSVHLAFESGATDFITKPINWALLAQRLRYALRSKHQEERLRESESRLAHAQRLARLGQWYYYLERRRISLSEGLVAHLGFDQASSELTLAELLPRVYQRDRFSLYRLLIKVYRSGVPGELEFRLSGPAGGLCTLHLYVERVGDGQLATLQGTLQDVSARIEAEARISYFAHYDSLTNLPNRVLFWDRLTQSIAESKRAGSAFAVMLMDLDRFSALNASVGHATGDRVLRTLAHRMTDNLRASDTVSRIAGDEFAIIYHEMQKESDLSHALVRLMSCFEAPVESNGLDAFVTVSIGIAIYPNDGADLDTLLMHADVAKGRAKQLPGSNYQFYTASMGDKARDRIAMEAALRRGLEDEAFVLHYQPLVSLSGSEVWGVEVLLRWQHPEQGLLLPDRFISILGEIGLIHEVGEWILQRACQEMKDYPFMVSVNLSPIQFGQADLLVRIGQILQQTAFPPERLQLEITENVFIEDPQQAKRTLEALRHLGIKVAIDDFGTGFSSLAYLKQYTTDYLKIDRSFIGGMQSDRANLAIVNSAIKLGHDLGMRIIGEGVEQAEVLESLMEMGCDVAQGYLIARPVSLKQLNQWLASR
jgi:diguanylate cyclase (GGDEF)-like protein